MTTDECYWENEGDPRVSKAGHRPTQGNPGGGVQTFQRDRALDNATEDSLTFQQVMRLRGYDAETRTYEDAPAPHRVLRLTSVEKGASSN